ncbi:hypothetical protein C8Q76DRAFT_632572, partial [Earliella scabrosa]
VVIVIYEHIFTAQEEYRVIWRRSFSAPSVLFLINHYTLLVVSIMYLTTCFAWWPDDYILSSSMIPLLTSLPVITAVRVHAINNRNWFWTIIVLALGTGTVLGNLVSPLIVLSGVCPHLLLSEALIPTIIVGTNSPITLDAVVLAITWYRTAGTFDHAQAPSRSNPVMFTLLRDGESSVRRIYLEMLSVVYTS